MMRIQKLSIGASLTIFIYYSFNVETLSEYSFFLIGIATTLLFCFGLLDMGDKQ